MARLEAKLGSSSETLRTIHEEMERDYYGAETRLVDPLLARSANMDLSRLFPIDLCSCITPSDGMALLRPHERVPRLNMVIGFGEHYRDGALDMCY